jgi:hypothetical protein
MKLYQIYLFLLELFILIIIGLVSLKYFPNKNKILLIIDSLFKFSIGLFLIIYFLNNNTKDLHDRVIFIVSGFIFILLIDYIQICKYIFENDKC